MRTNPVSFAIENTKTLRNRALEEIITHLLTKADPPATLAGIGLEKLDLLKEPRRASPPALGRRKAVTLRLSGDQSTGILAEELDMNVNARGVLTIADPVSKGMPS